MIPAVAKVPKIPSVKIGPAATRKRRQPTSVPPLKDRKALPEPGEDVGGDGRQ